MIRGLNHAMVTAEDTENQFRFKVSLDLNQVDKK